MSNDSNTNIRERAFEASEEAQNSMLGSQLDKAIKEDDLEAMRELTLAVERHLTFMETINDSEVK